LRRIGSPLLVSFLLTASFATVAWAQDTSSGTPIATPAATPASKQSPSSTSSASSPSAATDPAAPGTTPASPAPTPQIVTNTPLPTPTSPLALHVGDTDLTIGGFMDATAVIRSTNPGTGLGTSFGSLPFSNSPAGSLSETRLSAQNSRVTLTATSKAGDAAIKGYLEADFLGNAATNLDVTSNSNTLRMRLYWVQATMGKFEFLGGQSWSFITPNRNGLSPNPGDIFYSQDVDTNYQMGLTWGRVDQFRFVVHASSMVTAGVSLENPEQYTGSVVTMPAAFTAAEVDNGSNSNTPNLYPDVIAKIAFDPKTGGTHQHIEFGGLVRGFKTFDVPTGATHTATGKGGTVVVNVEPVKNLHFVGTGFFSTGGGRYIANTNLPDFIVNSDSSLTLVKSRSYIAGVEVQTMPKTQIYGYYSEARADAATTTDTNNKVIGFGVAAQNGANQKIMEGTFGITQVFFRDPKIGGMQLMIQYSYVKRTPFSVAPNAPTFAKANMVFVNVRYILP
jgi:hypothetical protein